MEANILDEALLPILQELEEITIRLPKLKSRSRGTVSVKNGYTYIQWKDGGKWQYQYLKKESPESVRIELQQRKKLYRLQVHRSRHLARIAVKSGIIPLRGFSESVINILSENHIIYGNGLLVGTFAFLAYQHMLGFSALNNLARTTDLDIARPKELLHNTTPVSLSSILEQTGENFYPDGPGGKITKYVFENGFRIENLYPHHSGPPERIVSPARTGFTDCGAEMLTHFSMLTDTPVTSILYSRKGAIPVSVPDPVSFTIHKILVAAKRKEKNKAIKDISQAAVLVHALKARGMIPEARGKTRKLKKAAASHFHKGLVLMEELHPQEAGLFE